MATMRFNSVSRASYTVANAPTPTGLEQLEPAKVALCFSWVQPRGAVQRAMRGAAARGKRRRRWPMPPHPRELARLASDLDKAPPSGNENALRQSRRYGRSSLLDLRTSRLRPKVRSTLHHAIPATVKSPPAEAAPRRLAPECRPSREYVAASRRGLVSGRSAPTAILKAVPFGCFFSFLFFFLLAWSSEDRTREHDPGWYTQEATSQTSTHDPRCREVPGASRLWPMPLGCRREVLH